MGLLLVVAGGCGDGSGYDGPPRLALKGKVTFNGEAVDGGSISFIPESGDQRVAGGPIIKGEYVVPESQGANAGQYRVEVRWPRSTGEQAHDDDTGEMKDIVKEVIPAQYNDASELKADVSESKTDFDFNLTAG